MKFAFLCLFFLTALSGFSQTAPDTKVTPEIPEKRSTSQFERLMEETLRYLSDLKEDGQKLAGDLKKEWELLRRETAGQNAENRLHEKPPLAEKPKRSPLRERKLKSFLLKNPKTVYTFRESGELTAAEIAAGTLFSSEDEITYFFNEFNGKEIVLTAVCRETATQTAVTQSGIEIIFRPDQYSKAASLREADLFSVRGILLPPSDFYPNARVIDAVFVMF